MPVTALMNVRMNKWIELNSLITLWRLYCLKDEETEANSVGETFLSSQGKWWGQWFSGWPSLPWQTIPHGGVSSAHQRAPGQMECRGFSLMDLVSSDIIWGHPPTLLKAGLNRHCYWGSPVHAKGAFWHSQWGKVMKGGFWEKNVDPLLHAQHFAATCFAFT